MFHGIGGIGILTGGAGCIMVETGIQRGHSDATSIDFYPTSIPSMSLCPLQNLKASKDYRENFFLPSATGKKL